MAVAMRFFKELERLKSKSVARDGFVVKSSDERTHNLKVDIAGPNDSPWAGGLFTLSVTCGADYPMKPPKAKFVGKIWHPNVGSNGDICLDVLQNMWSPALTLEQLFLSIASLLTDPNPDSPMNNEAATLYKRDRAQYDARIRKLVAQCPGDGQVQAYAGAVAPSEDKAAAGEASEEAKEDVDPKAAPKKVGAKAAPKKATGKASAKAASKAKAAPKAGTKRKAEEPVESNPPKKRAPWTCPECTFANTPSRKLCQMCDTARPDA
jgi:ubiquitin-conjugating enzyme E2 D/E